jgi:hypothetical protein
MIILHAAFCDTSLFLWGESSGENRVVSKKRRRIAPVAPFDLGDSGLLALASELSIGPISKSPISRVKTKAKSQTSGVQEAIAWLPSTGEQPVPSITDDLPDKDSCRVMRAEPKDPEDPCCTMRYQGVLTRTTWCNTNIQFKRENSLMQNRLSNIIGVPSAPLRTGSSLRAHPARCLKHNDALRSG